tara:strand:+ start:186 stop:614 length:429 start_codon:yes stop_codon:yes gene_type:complete
MATRSNSNKGVDKRKLNVPPPARNTQDNTQAVRRIPGVDYGEQQALTEQQQAAPLPKKTTPQTQTQGFPQMQLGTLDRATENADENILTGAMPLRPQNITVQDENGFPIARPNAEFRNSDMVSAYVQSGFNDDILNILIRTV